MNSMQSRGGTFRYGGYTVERFANAEAALRSGSADGPPATAGFPPHRLDWARALAPRAWWWLEVREDGGPRVAGYSVAVLETRWMPGHRMLRLPLLRFATAPGPAEAAVRYLSEFARTDGRTLSVSVEAMFETEEARKAAAGALAGAGYARAERVRMYSHTLGIDLAPPEEALFAALHPTTRRHIRAVAKRPVAIRLVDDAALAPRLDAILQATFDRTAGHAPPERWPELIAYGQAHPDVARLVSLVRTDRDGPDAVVAFALGINHGDSVEYATAGSARSPDLKFPLGYALAWDLIVWARRVGARWFDFGGISTRARDDDPRKGINEFKRMFGDDILEVRHEWTYVARPRRAAWVSLVRTGLRRIENTVSAARVALHRRPRGSDR